MTFHSIVRQWCRLYKPMLDSPKNRRFYLTDSMAGTVELAKKIATSLSPCVLMESGVEGGGQITRPERNYSIFFFVKATDMADGDAAALAKEMAWIHCQNFLTWLFVKHQEEMMAGRLDGDFARIDLDDAMIDIQTVGPIENAWFAVLVQFEREEPLNLCINEDLYIAEPSDESDSSEEEDNP